MTDLTNFIEKLDSKKLTQKDFFIAILWFLNHQGKSDYIELNSLNNLFHECLKDKVNLSRVRTQLKQDNRTTYKTKDDSFTIKTIAKKDLDSIYLNLLNQPIIPQSNSLLPHQLFQGTRGYIEKVVSQINESYTRGLYDCTAVMCRRLFETLIIEAYEANQSTSSITDENGNFYMLENLIKVVKSDYRAPTAKVKVGRNTPKLLNSIKEKGDSSAHNRRFNAKKEDLEELKNQMRTASEDLMHIANLIKKPS